MFSINGKLFNTLIKAGDFLILGLIGSLMCLPLVTVGASITAMFYSGLKLIKDEESYVIRDYFHSFKQNFKQGFLMQLIYMIIAALLVTDLRICSTWLKSSGGIFAKLMFFFAIGLLLVEAATMLYSFAALSRFENTVIGTVKNGLLLCMQNLPATLIMLFISGLLTMITLKYFTAYIVTLPVGLYMNSFVLVRVFRPFEKAASEVASGEVNDVTSSTASSEAGDEE